MLTSRIRSMRELVGNEDSLYSINNYQRFYVWDKDKVNTYLNDILKVIQRHAEPTPPKHFLGQFIVERIHEDDRGRKTYEVIDGQQRLTTFILLVAPIK